MSIFLLIKAELKRSLIMMKRYPLSFLSGITILYLIFMGLFLGGRAMAGGSISPAFGKTVEGFIVGYVMWFFTLAAVTSLSYSLTEEAQTGTLEQVYMTPRGAVWVLISRIIADFLPNLAIVVGLLYLIMVSTGIFLNIRVGSIALPLFLTILGLYGFGFILGGVTLIFKRIGPFTNLLQFLFLFLAMVPVEKFSPELQWIAYFLPLTHGVKVLRLIIVQGSQVGVGDFLALVLNSIGYLLLGILLYKVMDRIARDKGLLCHY